MAFLDLWKWYVFESITSYEITVFYSHYSTWMQQLIRRRCAYITLYLYGTVVEIKRLVLKLAHEVSRADNSHFINENTEAQRGQKTSGNKEHTWGQWGWGRSNTGLQTPGQEALCSVPVALHEPNRSFKLNPSPAGRKKNNVYPTSTLGQSLLHVLISDLTQQVCFSDEKAPDKVHRVSSHHVSICFSVDAMGSV